MNVDRGGFAEGVIRMLIMMARSRGEVRQSRLERSNEILNSREPFRSLGADRRARIIAEQTLILDFAPDQAFSALPHLLPTRDERQRAIDTVQEIAGNVTEMSESTLRMLARLREVLELPPLTFGVAAITPGVPVAAQTPESVPGK
ncbi:MAG: hypothetical protein ACJ8AI_21485 [Rhodopila sp.]